MKKDLNLLPLIEAWMRGKEIEVFSKIDLQWVPFKNPLWDSPASIYRVKAEPKYRPYQTIEEAQHLMGSVIKNKEGNHYEMVTSIITSPSEENGYVCINGIDSSRVLEDYTTIEGQPLGVKE